MKEVTYEDWLKNPTPRSMWVWDEDEELKVKRKVIYVLKDGVYTSPVLVVVDECMYETFRHCAEIGKQRRMTNKELARWLREKPTRECTHRNDSDYRLVYSINTYLEICANEEVDDCILIREDNGEWREPFVEVEE